LGGWELRFTDPLFVFLSFGSGRVGRARWGGRCSFVYFRGERWDAEDGTLKPWRRVWEVGLLGEMKMQCKVLCSSEHLQKTSRRRTLRVVDQAFVRVVIAVLNVIFVKCTRGPKKPTSPSALRLMQTGNACLSWTHPPCSSKGALSNSSIQFHR
jgi:hypothetical protein